MRKILFSLMMLLAMSPLSLDAQALKVPAPSPLQTFKQNFALGEVSVEYSRPSAKSRVIFGDVVPFGKIWRTGANASTKITFSDAVKLEGVTVQPGTYALYTIPGKDVWEVMLYSDLNLGGSVHEYKTENEVLRLKVKPSTLPALVETFTIQINNVKPSSASIDLSWEKTQVSIALTADIDERIMKNIEKSLAADTRPYYQSASYYYENNKDLGKALEWVNKATEQSPKAFWIMLLKAKIQLKSGDKKGAIESANKTIELAKEAQSDDYVKMAEKLIAEAKK
ncbi:MAG: DUF2911 domain-containing protein [Bacteroidia bacterium]|jgi:hypothetical protein|nr:DUF2911 domain-containing protein [Bacteroidia bacterium]MCC6768625.1 DUF2911 domain-containing protein [Bacteroidia bacterium]